MTPRKLVNKLEQDYGTNNPFSLCTYLGIRVEYFEGKNVRGLATEVLGCPVILLNSTLQGFSKYFVLAHEIFHVLEHDIKEANFSKKHTFQKTDVFEKEANTFAALLLLDSATHSFAVDCEALDEDVQKEILKVINQY